MPTFGVKLKTGQAACSQSKMMAPAVEIVRDRSGVRI